MCPALARRTAGGHRALEGAILGDAATATIIASLEREEAASSWKRFASRSRRSEGARATAQASPLRRLVAGKGGLEAREGQQRRRPGLGEALQGRAGDPRIDIARARPAPCDGMHWLDDLEDPRTLGALRIALGVCLLGDVASLLPHLEYLYGEAGDAAYSLDNVLRRRRLARRGALDEGDPTHASFMAIPAWPRRLMIFQLCVLFCVAGWLKGGATFDDGTSFYYLVANDRWYRFPPWWMLHHFGDNLMRLATWIALWFERLFPLVAVGFLLRWRLGDRLLRIVRVVTSRWIWASLAIAFTGSLLVFANIGWFVPATLVATLVLFRGEEIGGVVDRLLRRRSPPSVSPRAISPARLGRGILVAFLAWHVAAVVIQSFDRKPLELPVPPALRKLAGTYGRITNTWQFWGMFQRGAPRVQQWLVVDVIDEGGVTRATFDDRVLLGGRDYPYIGVDRRQKVHSNLINHEPWRRRHIDYLCRTWVGPEGEAPAEVILRVWSWLLPTPAEMAAIGPVDPTPWRMADRRTRTLRSRRCLPDPAVDPEPDPDEP